MTLRAAATWLVCKEDCIPERGEFALTLPVGSCAPTAHAPLFEELRSRLPKPLSGAGWQAAEGGLRLHLSGLSLTNLREVWFFAEDYGVLDHAAEQVAKRADGRLVLSLKAGELGLQDGQTLRGVLVVQRDGAAGPFTEAWAIAAGPTPPASAVPGPALALGMALAGGLLLNLTVHGR